MERKLAFVITLLIGTQMKFSTFILINLPLMYCIELLLLYIHRKYKEYKDKHPNSEQKKESEQITTSFTDEDEEVITRVKTIMGGV